MRRCWIRTGTPPGCWPSSWVAWFPVICPIYRRRRRGLVQTRNQLFYCAMNNNLEDNYIIWVLSCYSDVTWALWRLFIGNSTGCSSTDSAEQQIIHLSSASLALWGFTSFRASVTHPSPQNHPHLATKIIIMIKNNDYAIDNKINMIW